MSPFNIMKLYRWLVGKAHGYWYFVSIVSEKGNQDFTIEQDFPLNTSAAIKEFRKYLQDELDCQNIIILFFKELDGK